MVLSTLATMVPASSTCAKGCKKGGLKGKGRTKTTQSAETWYMVCSLKESTDAYKNMAATEFLRSAPHGTDIKGTSSECTSLRLNLKRFRRNELHPSNKKRVRTRTCTSTSPCHSIQASSNSKSPSSSKPAKGPPRKKRAGALLKLAEQNEEVRKSPEESSNSKSLSSSKSAKDSLRQNCIGALRKLAEQGSILPMQKRVLLTDIIRCSAKGESSMVEVAYELLCGEAGDSSEESEEEFADQCRVFAESLETPATRVV
jgi:hypothetical protein